MSQLKTIENQLNKQFNESPIRLEKFLRKRKESLEDFAIAFFKKYNFEKNTIFVNSKEVHTTLARRRSLGDLYVLFKYYYPDLTLEQMVKLLLVDLRKEEKLNPGYRSSFCWVVGKRMFYYNPSMDSQFHNLEKEDEYLMKYDDYLKEIEK